MDLKNVKYKVAFFLCRSSSTKDPSTHQLTSSGIRHLNPLSFALILHQTLSSFISRADIYQSPSTYNLRLDQYFSIYICYSIPFWGVALVVH